MLTLVSHQLCPYVQRAAIVAAEKNIPLKRIAISLADKPDWFLAISPTGKVPVLQVGETALFESNVICEYLEEAHAGQMHPEDPLERARHRAWMEFASAILNDIGGLYSASDALAFEAKRAALATRVEALEEEIAGPWFAGERFHMVDAFYGSVFRYFDVIEHFVRLAIFDELSLVPAWRRRLAERPSVIAAVDATYRDRLTEFLLAKRSYLSGLISSAQGA